MVDHARGFFPSQVSLVVIYLCPGSDLFCIMWPLSHRNYMIPIQNFVQIFNRSYQSFYGRDVSKSYDDYHLQETKMQQMLIPMGSLMFRPSSFCIFSTNGWPPLFFFFS